MNIEKILNSGLINISELARRLWPDKSGSQPRLQKKIKNQDKQRLTEKDKQGITKILQKEFEL